MQDRNNNTLVPECKLQSELLGKNSLTIIYKGDDTFECPGGGSMYHDQESLLESHWVVVEYPKNKSTCKVCTNE